MTIDSHSYIEAFRASSMSRGATVRGTGSVPSPRKGATWTFVRCTKRFRTSRVFSLSFGQSCGRAQVPNRSLERTSLGKPRSAARLQR